MKKKQTHKPSAPLTVAGSLKVLAEIMDSRGDVSAAAILREANLAIRQLVADKNMLKDGCESAIYWAEHHHEETPTPESARELRISERARRMLKNAGVPYYCDPPARIAALRSPTPVASQ